ncbi:MAG TPA: SDR family NAD(P)-dependent oxidoreductase [Chitinophagales bacterium]|nr:SDR family NAD(P)-dependent oxidoreductase [Chitinophagales bacterium]
MPLCTIVGMGPGNGFSIAKRFAKEGFMIAMISRPGDDLKSLQQKLNALGYSSYDFYAEAADFGQLRKAFDEVKLKLGDTEVLVYNVSIYREATPTALDAETCVHDFRANVAGVLVAVQHVVPAMKANGKGTILITGGGQALNPLPLLSSLGIGKAGIRNLAWSLHGELKPFGIHAGTVTINGQVKPGTKFDPDLISEEFWKLHSQPDGQFEREVIYQ